MIFVLNIQNLDFSHTWHRNGNVILINMTGCTSSCQMTTFGAGRGENSVKMKTVSVCTNLYEHTTLHQPTDTPLTRWDRNKMEAILTTMSRDY